MAVNFDSMSFAEIIASARQLVKDERGIIADLIRHLIVIESLKIYAMEGYSSLFNYCTEALGLSHNKACKRVAAARIARFYPELLTMLENGEVSVSVLALLPPKLTEANYELVIEGIKNRSKREAELFLSTISLDGEQLPDEPRVEVKILCPQEVFHKLERAKEILAPGGQTWADVLDEALEAFLEKNDPLRKAERAKKRDEAKETRIPVEEKEAEESEAAGAIDFIPGETQGPGIISGDKDRADRYIPQAIRHAVTARDEGCCSYVSPEGKRCGTRKFLELDHRIPWALGGQNEVSNLRLLCRAHNLYVAEKIMGVEFMRGKRGSTETGWPCSNPLGVNIGQGRA